MSLCFSSNPAVANAFPSPQIPGASARTDEIAEQLHQSLNNGQNSWTSLDLNSFQDKTLRGLLTHVDKEYEGNWKSIAITLEGVITFIHKNEEGKPVIFIPEEARMKWPQECRQLDTEMWHSVENLAAANFIASLLSHCLTEIRQSSGKKDMTGKMSNTDWSEDDMHPPEFEIRVNDVDANESRVLEEHMDKGRQK